MGAELSGFETGHVRFAGRANRYLLKLQVLYLNCRFNETIWAPKSVVWV